MINGNLCNLKMEEKKGCISKNVGCLSVIFITIILVLFYNLKTDYRIIKEGKFEIHTYERKVPIKKERFSPTISVFHHEIFVNNKKINLNKFFKNKNEQIENYKVLWFNPNWILVEFGNKFCLLKLVNNSVKIQLLFIENNQSFKNSYPINNLYNKDMIYNYADGKFLNLKTLKNSEIELSSKANSLIINDNNTHIVFYYGDFDRYFDSEEDNFYGDFDCDINNKLLKSKRDFFNKNKDNPIFKDSIIKTLKYFLKIETLQIENRTLKKQRFGILNWDLKTNKKSKYLYNDTIIYNYLNKKQDSSFKSIDFNNGSNLDYFKWEKDSNGNLQLIPKNSKIEEIEFLKN